MNIKLCNVWYTKTTTACQHIKPFRSISDFKKKKKNITMSDIVYHSYIALTLKNKVGTCMNEVPTRFLDAFYTFSRVWEHKRGLEKPFNISMLPP